MRITISGSPGAGKSTVATLVAKKLKLKHYSIGGLMREFAHKKGLSLLELSKLAEKEKRIDEELDKAQIKLGKEKDNFVLDSRLGYHFVPNSVKIYLGVSINEAAKRIFKARRGIEKENLTLKKTVENIKRRKKSETLRYKKFYNLNPFNKKQYDFVIDTTNLRPEEVARRIVKYVKQTGI